MISTEVQRTLVKSPPELWAELSDQDALGRHLSELGDVRITTTKPEQTVEWEAEAAHGKVELKPSGWGTKVTISVMRKGPSAPPVKQKQETEMPAQKQELQPSQEHEQPKTKPTAPVAVEKTPKPIEGGPAAQPDEQVTGETGTAEVARPAVTEPFPRRRLLVRLFRRLARAGADAPSSATAQEPIAAQEASATQEPMVEPAATQEPIAAQELPAVQAVTAAAEPMSAEQPAVEPGLQAADLAAELAAVEEAIALQTTKLLNGVLDRLGAAHHRPFSRA